MDKRDKLEKYKYLIEENIPSRKDNILKMISKCENTILTSPLNPLLHENNCYVGGYIDSVFSMVDLTTNTLNTYINKHNIDCNVESLLFVSMFYNIGRITDGNYNRFIVNNSEWHVKNQNKKYVHNPKVSFMIDKDRTIFLFMKNNIDLSEEEYLSILLQEDNLIDTNNLYTNNYDYNLNVKYKLPDIIKFIRIENNIKLSAINSLDMEQESMEFSMSREKNKIYNTNKKNKSKKIGIDIKMEI